MDTEMFLLELEEHMQKACEYTLHEFSTVRTGKASPSLVEGIDIFVPAYNSNMKLKQLALISTPEPRLIYVKPFDPSTLRDIERGLKEAKVELKNRKAQAAQLVATDQIVEHVRRALAQW